MVQLVIIFHKTPSVPCVDKEQGDYSLRVNIVGFVEGCGVKSAMQT
jgi:hypothetical protein